jgi:CRP-like cAMP-binding protein
MDEALIAKLLDVGQECEFDAGHVLIEPNQPGSGLFLIRHGTVIVEAPEGRRELGAGHVVGERALDASHGLRSARVVAKTAVRAVAVDRAAYEAARQG